MTPKEKAKDLYVKFSDYCSWNTFEEEQDYINNIKQCALIAVDEVMQKTLWDKGEQRFWAEVKQEIENL